MIGRGCKTIIQFTGRAQCRHLDLISSRPARSELQLLSMSILYVGVTEVTARKSEVCCETLTVLLRGSDGVNEPPQWFHVTPSSCISRSITSEQVYLGSCTFYEEGACSAETLSSRAYPVSATWHRGMITYDKFRRHSTSQITNLLSFVVSNESRHSLDLGLLSDLLQARQRFLLVSSASSLTSCVSTSTLTKTRPGYLSSILAK